MSSRFNLSTAMLPTLSFKFKVENELFPPCLREAGWWRLTSLNTGNVSGLFWVFYTEKQTFGVWQTDRWLSRRFIFLCQTWPTFTLRRKHTHMHARAHTHTHPCPDIIMSPWKNSYSVRLKEGLFSHCGFYITKRLIKDHIQKALPRHLWSDWGTTRSHRMCRKSRFFYLVALSCPNPECSCQKWWKVMWQRMWWECDGYLLQLCDGLPEETVLLDFCTTYLKKRLCRFYFASSATEN